MAATKNMKNSTFPGSPRGKPGVKRSLLVDDDGGPLATVVAGANVPDAQLLAPTLDAVIAERPEPEPEYPQHLCPDKAFDNETGWETTVERAYEPHIVLNCDERPPRLKRHPARRWVVERTISWLNSCRAILVRYAKQAENYLGLIKLACALLWYRRLHRLTVLR
jgi:putative transposase